jgi:hypothetical protein
MTLYFVTELKLMQILETLPSDLSNLREIVVFFVIFKNENFWKIAAFTYIYIMNDEYLQFLCSFFHDLL